MIEIRQLAPIKRKKKKKLGHEISILKVGSKSTEDVECEVVPVFGLPSFHGQVEVRPKGVEKGKTKGGRTSREISTYSKRPGNSGLWGRVRLKGR